MPKVYQVNSESMKDLSKEVREGRMTPQEAMFLLGKQIKENPDKFPKRKINIDIKPRFPKLNETEKERVKYFHN